jgi:basic membrane lipoprotein Med (substrate-binding protein (PBP1-ABC) superfamily)
VLKHFGATRIAANVTRILPENDGSPRIKAYYEFLDFYKATGLYTVQFRRPGDYAKLLAALGKEPADPWTDREKLSFNAAFQYFRDAFESLNGPLLELQVEEALLVWLQIYSYQDLTDMTGDALKKSLTAIWEDLTAMAQPEPVKVETQTPKAKGSLLGRIISGAPEHLRVAFIHQLSIERSGWTKAHDEGRQYLEQVMGDAVTAKSYFGADTPELTEQILEQAVEEGAQVIFTTAPQQGRATLKAAVKYPKLRFLNCAVNVPYSSIRSYYCRMYEGKFVTGAIAGAMSANDHIGYIASYPIYGEIASVNAFALGAQLTNPRAKIHLRWSCTEGTNNADFIKMGIRVISNRDIPSQDRNYLNFCNYGTYQIGDDAQLTPLGSPHWNWGKLYEHILRSIMSGTWDADKDNRQAVNYWWGMDTGVVDIQLSDKLPDGVKALAQLLIEQLQQGLLDPFARRIVAQDGSLINDGSRSLTADELLRMDQLCSNVEGQIPGFHELMPMARSMVRELGIYKEEIPAEKEVPCEDSGRV